MAVLPSALFLCLTYFVLPLNFVSSDEVPVMFWNIKGNSFLTKPASALGNDDTLFKKSIKEILEDNSNILVYAVNKLSLEDFSANEKPTAANSTIQNLQTFLDTQRYMFLSSVHDPVSHIHEVHCGVQEIVLDHSIDDSILKSISQAFKRSCVVVLHVMDSGLTESREPDLDALKKVFSPPFSEDSKNVVAVFTAMQSSWGGGNDEHHLFRNLLAAEENLGSFVNISGCLLMYADNATLWYKANNKTVRLPFPADYTGSKCGNETALLQLNFKPTDEPEVVIKFNFTRVINAWVTSMELETSSIVDQLYSDDLEAAVGFSFACGNYVVRNINRTVTLKIDRFQVQPFAVKEQFSDSFDCVTWFTVPIWMGIFISLLCIIIVSSGVYALFNVNTMDRFDDPKGKTITVNTGVE